MTTWDRRFAGHLYLADDSLAAKAVARDRPRILLIDDDPANLDLLLEAFERRSFDVYVAESGESALTQLEYLRPDLILLDVAMPDGLNGFGTFARIQSRPGLREVPVIFLSGVNDSFTRLRGLRLGGADYISKPFDVEEVLMRVETHLRYSWARRRLNETKATLESQIRLQRDTHDQLYNALKVPLLIALRRRRWQAVFSTRRAEELIERYFDCILSVDLPDHLGDWLDLGSSGALEVTQPEGTLLIRRQPMPSRGNIVTMVLDERPVEQPACSPEPLKRLGLTAREAEVLFWVAQGKTSPEIGIILSAATATIKKHVQHILAKLGLESRLGAALLAAEILGHPPAMAAPENSGFPEAAHSSGLPDLFRTARGPDGDGRSIRQQPPEESGVLAQTAIPRNAI
jgi:DNA-binding response OmpR family regulator/DNA-binding CsgD family transcriptional regulator